MKCNFVAPLTIDLCAAEAQTITKHTMATLKKMSTGKNCYLFWKGVKQKTTKLDVDASKLSIKRRAPARIEKFFGEKAAPEYANGIISHCRRIYFESLDLIINATEDRFDQEKFRNICQTRKSFVESSQR